MARPIGIVLPTFSALAFAQERKFPQSAPAPTALNRSSCAFDDAPPRFNTSRSDLSHGTVDGSRRKANVYLPPGYSANSKYPVLYLLSDSPAL